MDCSAWRLKMSPEEKRAGVTEIRRRQQKKRCILSNDKQQHLRHVVFRRKRWAVIPVNAENWIKFAQKNSDMTSFFNTTLICRSRGIKGLDVRLQNISFLLTIDTWCYCNITFNVLWHCWGKNKKCQRSHPTSLSARLLKTTTCYSAAGWQSRR